MMLGLLLETPTSTGNIPGSHRHPNTLSAFLAHRLMSLLVVVMLVRSQ